MRSVKAMKELNVATHKTWRPSYSNILSELPEVEEPNPDVVSPILVHGLQKEETSDKLPPITDVSPLTSEYRPRIHSLPTVTKKAYQNGKNVLHRSFSSEPTPSKSYEAGHMNDDQSYLKSLETTLGRPYVKRELPNTVEYRRWSIGPPVSREYRIALSEGRNSRDSGDGKCNRTIDGNLPQSMTNDTQKNEMPLTCNPVKSPRRISEPEQVIEEKEPVELTQDPLLNRRWSNPIFADTTKKVNMLLRIGQLRKNKMNPTDVKADQTRTIRTLADLAIEMPRNPRFSALMSPEAQYSIMMGYEDKLYENLTHKFPDKKKVLKRNKTPIKKVHIRRKNSIGFVDDDDEEDDDISDDEVSDQNVSTQSSFITQPTDHACNLSGTNFNGSKYHQHRGSTQSLDSSISELPERPDSRTTLQNIRRLSVSLEKKHYLNRLFDKVDDDDDSMDGTYLSLHRSYSLPNVNTGTLPFNRRLMMTHRLESAMDILDAMKGQGEFQLSPRLKTRKSIPITDYNSWVHEWNKEFRVQQGNNS